MTQSEYDFYGLSTNRPKRCHYWQLPWPPSINHYWRRVGARTLISRAGREYRSTIIATVGPVEPITTRIRVGITAHPPDRRRRDLDNLLKPLLDCLQSAGVYGDDEQIDDLRITRGQVEAGGVLLVTVESL